jgi:hypothetical protein
MGEEIVNLSKAEVQELIKNFPLKPFGNRVIITINRLEEEGELITSNNMLAEEQYVIAVGPMAERFTTPGDRVILDLEKLTVKAPVDHDQYQLTSQIKIDPIEIDGLQFAIVNDNSFKAKYIE